MKLRTRNFKGKSDLDGVDLGRYAYASGPNGAGKSRLLEAVHFALYGQLTSRYQQTNQASAELFGPDGGYCELSDSEGNWIRHELSWKGKSVQVTKTSSDEQTISGGEGARRWAGNRLLLDLPAFEELKPEEKGRYILELCGSDLPASEAKVMRRVEDEVARIIGGPMASREHIRALDEKLPKPVREIARMLVGDRGVLAQAGSFLDGRDRPSVACLKLIDYSKGELAAVRRRRKEFDAQLAGLRTEDTAQKVRESDVHRYERRYDSAMAMVREAEIAESELGVLRAGLENLREQFESTKREYEESKAVLSVATPPGEKPEEPKFEAPPEDYVKTLRSIDDKLAGARDNLKLLEQLKEGVSHREELLAREKAYLEELKGSQVRQLCLEAIKLADGAEAEGDVIEEAQTVRQLATSLLHREEKKVKATTLEIDKAEKDIAERSRKISDLESRNFDGMIEELLEDRAAVAKSQSDWQAIGLAKQKAYQDALFAWQEETNEYGTLVARTGDLKTRFEKERDNFNSRAGDVTKAESRAKAAKVDSLEDFRRVAEESREQANKARELLGEYAQYLEVAQGQEDAAATEEAWKAVIDATKIVREEFVREAADRLLEKANKHYQGVFPEEKIDIQLETPTGKTTCRFSIDRAGQEISDRALSEGEWMMAFVAFSLASASLSRGFKALLVEAQPLDRRNLPRLLSMVARGDTSLAMIASTLTPEEFLEPASGKWTFIDVAPKEVESEDKVEVSKGRRVAELKDDAYFAEVRDWWNNKMAPACSKRACGRLGAKRKRKILKMRESHPDWMDIYLEHLEENPQIRSMALIQFDQFVQPAMLDDWKLHRWNPRTEKKAPGLSKEEVLGKKSSPASAGAS